MSITLIKLFSWGSPKVEVVQTTFSNQNAIIQSNILISTKILGLLWNQNCNLSTYKSMTIRKKNIIKPIKIQSQTIHRGKCMAPSFSLS